MGGDGGRTSSLAPRANVARHCRGPRASGVSEASASVGTRLPWRRCASANVTASRQVLRRSHPARAATSPTFGWTPRGSRTSRDADERGRRVIIGARTDPVSGAGVGSAARGDRGIDDPAQEQDRAGRQVPEEEQERAVDPQGHRLGWHSRGAQDHRGRGRRPEALTVGFWPATLRAQPASRASAHQIPVSDRLGVSQFARADVPSPHNRRRIVAAGADDRLQHLSIVHSSLISSRAAGQPLTGRAHAVA
jgi:hypothetical protein